MSLFYFLHAFLYSQACERFELLRVFPMYLVGIRLNHLAKSAVKLEKFTEVISTQEFQHHLSTPFTLMVSSSSSCSLTILQT